MATSRVYKGNKPNISIDNAGGANLGRCYNASYYRIVSLTPLSTKQIHLLHTAGFLGYGQEFYIRGQERDGKLHTVPDEIAWNDKPAPSGVDTVQCSEVDDATGEIVRTPSINPYSGKEDGSIQQPYWVYRCESRVDSSD